MRPRIGIAERSPLGKGVNRDEPDRGAEADKHRYERSEWMTAEREDQRHDGACPTDDGDGRHCRLDVAALSHVIEVVQQR